MHSQKYYLLIKILSNGETTATDFFLSVAFSVFTMPYFKNVACYSDAFQYQLFLHSSLSLVFQSIIYLLSWRPVNQHLPTTFICWSCTCVLFTFNDAKYPRSRTSEAVWQCPLKHLIHILSLSTSLSMLMQLLFTSTSLYMYFCFHSPVDKQTIPVLSRPTREYDHSWGLVICELWNGELVKCDLVLWTAGIMRQWRSQYGANRATVHPGLARTTYVIRERNG